MEHHHLADFAFPNGRFGAELSNGTPYYIYPNMVRGFSGLELDLAYHGGYRRPDVFTPDKLNYDPSAATRLDERRGTPVHHLVTDRWVNPKQDSY